VVLSVCESGQLSEVLPNLLTDGISVGLDDLMPHFFQRPVSVSRHFSFHANISDFFTAVMWLAGWVICGWGRNSQSRKVGEIFL
jgi:hypothetical protein